MRPKWDYQEGWSSWQLAVDEVDFWFWRHLHWLWLGKEGLLQWWRDRE